MKSFRQWINESEVVFIDTKKYNLKAKYDYYNRILFDNELPSITPIWSTKLERVVGRTHAKVFVNRFSNTSGVVRGMFYRNLGRMQEGTLKILLRSNLRRTEQEYDAILIHEMIHAWFFVLGAHEENHGLNFQNKCRELTKKVGFTISIKDDVDILDRTESKPIPTVFVLMREGQKHIVALYPANAKMVEKYAELERFVDRAVQRYRTEEAWIYVTNSVLSFGVFGMSRIVPPKKVFVISPNKKDAILKEIGKGSLKYHVTKATMSAKAA